MCLVFLMLISSKSAKISEISGKKHFPRIPQIDADKINYFSFPCFDFKIG